MNLSDDIRLMVITSRVDENLDPIEITEWVDLGKCAIVQNSSARKIILNDGVEYSYSYEVFYRKKKDMPIPHEGDTIHIIKKDGTIDKDCKVAGFMTMRNWIKLWV